MELVDEYVRMAEEAQEDGAHVAVLMNYRSAIEAMESTGDSASYLLTAIQYAQGLKKEGDRTAIVNWGQEVLEIVNPGADLEATIKQEIAKLQTIGNENVTS